MFYRYTEICRLTIHQQLQIIIITNTKVAVISEAQELKQKLKNKNYCAKLPVNIKVGIAILNCTLK